MTDSEILSLYIPLVNFLGDALGDNTEVVLHDVSSPESSVIAIKNGFHTGRTIGSSLTDYALQLKHNKEYETSDYVVNYRAKAKGNEFISSTFHIKNNGRLIGMLCLNTNTSAVHDFVKATKQFITTLHIGGAVLSMDSNREQNCSVEENLDIPIVSFADSIIARTIAESNIPPERMTRKEKMEIVWNLDERGIPRMKGAISEIARQLGLSESTVYRYINLKK